MYNKINLPRLAVVITTRCNLKCRHCSVGVATQQEAYHISLEDFKQQLNLLFSVVNNVKSLEFAGGEPFIHSELPLMIEEFMQYKDRFEQWLIVTNGTIPFNDSLITALEKSKDCGILHLSDYNIYPDKTRKFTQMLDEISFKYRVDKYYGDDQYQGGWVDPGPMVSRGRNEKSLRSVFANCGLVKNGGCWRLYKGKIHLCTRSMRCIDVGFNFPTDYVDLLDTTTSTVQKAEKLRTIYNAAYIMACDYCNGDLGTRDKSKRFPAAEQVSLCDEKEYT
jgi:hypothetical protein